MEVTRGVKELPCSNRENPRLRKMEIENRQAHRSTTELCSFYLKVCSHTRISCTNQSLNFVQLT